ncbi:MAG TPA: ComEA family DNA-binding protein [Thermomicrobiales bacterium]|nr:ComEA family DNA-binding protein [Thermomicrobiales bacterium]
MARTLSILSIAVAVLGGIVLVVTFYRELDRRDAPPIIIEDPVDEEEIVVSVEGAVASPGLVSLPAGSRWGDAIRVSGGMLPGADLTNVNPAARLADGERLLIGTLPPRSALSMVETPPLPGASPGVADDSQGGAASDLININFATEAELDALPGIGPTLARRIIERRTSLGRFTSVDELEDIQGISARMVNELRPFVTV